MSIAMTKIYYYSQIHPTHDIPLEAANMENGSTRCRRVQRAGLTELPTSTAGTLHLKAGMISVYAKTANVGVQVHFKERVKIRCGMQREWDWWRVVWWR
jgi:hypothetical protein